MAKLSCESRLDSPVDAHRHSDDRDGLGPHRSVVGARRRDSSRAAAGIISGRQRTDNVCEVESAMLSFSAVRSRTAAVVFFGFGNAFPSLSRRWMLAALPRLGLSCGLRRLVSQLYAG